jgi:hypothetical protein
MTNNEFYNLLKSGKTEEEILNTLTTQLNAAKKQLAAETQKNDAILKAREGLTAAFKTYYLALESGLSEQEIDATIAVFNEFLKAFEGELNGIKVKVEASPKTKEIKADTSTATYAPTSSLDNISKLINFAERFKF